MHFLFFLLQWIKTRERGMEMCPHCYFQRAGDCFWNGCHWKSLGEKLPAAEAVCGQIKTLVIAGNLGRRVTHRSSETQTGSCCREFPVPATQQETDWCLVLKTPFRCGIFEQNSNSDLETCQLTAWLNSFVYCMASTCWYFKTSKDWRPSSNLFGRLFFFYQQRLIHTRPTAPNQESLTSKWILLFSIEITSRGQMWLFWHE